MFNNCNTTIHNSANVTPTMRMKKTNTYSKRVPRTRNYKPTKEHDLFDEIRRGKRASPIISDVGSGLSDDIGDGDQSQKNASDGPFSDHADSDAGGAFLTLSQGNSYSRTKSYEEMGAESVVVEAASLVAEHEKLTANSRTRYRRSLYGSGAGHIPHPKPVKSPRFGAQRYINLSPACSEKKQKRNRKSSECSSRRSLQTDDCEGSTTVATHDAGSTYTYMEVTDDSAATSKQSNQHSKLLTTKCSESSYTFVEMTARTTDQSSPCETLRREYEVDLKSIDLLSPVEKRLANNLDNDALLLDDSEEEGMMHKVKKHRLNSTLLDHHDAKDINDIGYLSDISAIPELCSVGEEEPEMLPAHVLTKLAENTPRLDNMDWDENIMRKEHETTPNAKTKPTNRKAFKQKTRPIEKCRKLQPKSSTFIEAEKTVPSLICDGEISSIPTESTRNIVESKMSLLDTKSRTPKKESSNELNEEESKEKKTSTPILGHRPPFTMMELSSIGEDLSLDELQFEVSAVVNSQEIHVDSVVEVVQQDDKNREQMKENKSPNPTDGADPLITRMLGNPSGKIREKEVFGDPQIEHVFKVPKVPVKMATLRSTLKNRQRLLPEKQTTESDVITLKNHPCCFIPNLLEKYPNHPGPRLAKVCRRNRMLRSVPDGEHQKTVQLNFPS